MEKEFRVTDDILASHGKRFLNNILDSIFFYLFFMGIIMIQGLIDESTLYTDEESFSSLIFYYLFYVFMFFILELLTQRTIAKYITQTLVVLENGEKPEVNTLLKRSFSRLIPFEPFSFLGTPCRGWHDTISKTYVVDEKKFNAKKIAVKDFEDLGKPIDEVVF